jgi:hypothetical protein
MHGLAHEKWLQVKQEMADERILNKTFVKKSYTFLAKFCLKQQQYCRLLLTGQPHPYL